MYYKHRVSLVTIPTIHWLHLKFQRQILPPDEHTLSGGSKGTAGDARPRVDPIYYRPQTKSVHGGGWGGGFCMMSLPVSLPGPMVSVQGVSVQGVSLRWGLCLGVSVQVMRWGLCPRGSLSKGISIGGGFCRRPPDRETLMLDGWAVCILLECYLIISSCSFWQNIAK